MSRADSGYAKKSIWSRLLSVRTTLRNVLYINYALPVEKLRNIVPSALQIATINHDQAFVSVVLMQNTRVRLQAFPLVRFNYNQLNIRTYVIDPLSGLHGVYFLRSGVTSIPISLATNTLGIPWRFIKMAINLNSQTRPSSISASGRWEGPFVIQARDDSALAGPTALFEDRNSAIDFLIRPLIGFSGNARHLVRFTIQHPPVQPADWTLTRLDYPFLDRLISPDDPKQLHSVFYLPEAQFSIFLPPQKVNYPAASSDLYAYLSRWTK